MREFRERVPRYLANVANEDAILAAAARIIDRRFVRLGVITAPADAGQMLKLRLGGESREVMFALYLDARHQVISVQEASVGTLSSCAVYPRELAREALRLNAAALLLAHNHPSGTSEPSQTDRELTERVRAALALLEIRLLDHLVIAADVVSFAERGFL